MTRKQFRMIVNIVATIIGAIIAFGVTYLDSKYFLMGVEAERGYEAVGGEFIFLLLIFAGMYYSIKHLIIKVVKDIVVEMEKY